MGVSPQSIQLLHVDDEPDLAEMAAEFLQRSDDRISVDTVTSASEGLDRLGENGYDCVVSDYDMPGQNGIEFLQTVREDHPDFPFILYTGKGSEEVASEAIAAGVSDYLQKEAGTSHYEVLANRIRNVVQKRRSEKEVSEKEYWTNRLLEHSSDYLFVTDKAGKISYMSPSVERVLGYDPDAMTGEDAFEYAYPQDLEKATETFAEMLERPEEEEVTVEFRARHADGGYRWLEVRGRNLLDDSVIEGILVNARDISQRKERERELEEQRSNLRLYKRAVESSTDLLAATDLDGNLLFANEQYRAYHGLTADEVPNVRLPELLGDAWESTVKAEVERAFAGETVEYEMERPGPDGDPIRLHIKYYPLRDEDGAIVGSVASMRDVSGRNVGTLERGHE